MTLTVTQIFRDCMIEINCERLQIDLIMIAIWEVCVIVGMDWLDTYDAEIVCRHNKCDFEAQVGENY